MSESSQNLKLVPLPDNKLYKFEEVCMFSPTLPDFVKEIIQKEIVYCVLIRKSDSDNQIISYRVRVYRPILTTAYSESNQKPKFCQSGKFFWIEFRLTEDGCYQRMNKCP